MLSHFLPANKNLMQKKFQKKIENFVCLHCGEEVKGTGYTNHCPKCLWSKHVDIFPGDRQNVCLGSMEPIGVFFQNQQWHICQKCTECGHKAKIKMSKNDNQKKIQDLIEKTIKEK